MRDRQVKRLIKTLDKIANEISHHISYMESIPLSNAIVQIEKYKEVL